VKQVLAFGRGLAGDRIILQPKHIIHEVAKIVEETFPKSLILNTDIPRNLWTISADPTQMHQVILNVCVNARDAMPKGGSLTISAANVTLDENSARLESESKPGPHVAISIADTGTGIPPEITEKIFEPFFTTKEMGQGTGLGLSTTLGIVKSHGGFIDVKSEIGRGTTFTIYLPAMTTESMDSARDEDALPAGHGELILAIDDEEPIREIMKETLGGCGFRVVTARDGAEGLQEYARQKADIRVVITDMMMPNMDGAATILALREMNPDLKIIGVSGLMGIGDGPGMAESGMTRFLPKPHTSNELVKLVHEILAMG
jgi:two-component system cell cycle sensor histidine kinase/response regulator CckA